MPRETRIANSATFLPIKYKTQCSLKAKHFNLVLRSKFNLFLVLMHEGDWKQVFVKSYLSFMVRYFTIRDTFYMLSNIFSFKVIPLFSFPGPFSMYSMYYLIKYKFSRVLFQNSSLYIKERLAT